jgi:superfamily II DNA or RNA helicase
MSFRNLGKFDLEKRIGTELLERLKELLPYVDSNIDEDSLYHTRNLEKIFTSFSDSKIFKDKEFRKKYLLLQNEEKINKLCSYYNISNYLTIPEKVDTILKKGWKDKEFCEIFTEIFELPKNFIPEEQIFFSNLENINGCTRPYKILKDYQIPVFLEAQKQIQNRNSRFIIQMPTGSGKTRTAMEFISDIFINHDDALIIWLVNSEELCEQAVESFIDIWGHVGNKEISLIRVWGDNDLIIPQEGKSAFIVAGFQKMYSIFKNDNSKFDILKSRTFLIVVDEAHRVLAPTYSEITESLFGINSRLVGLSATPGRSLEDNEENLRLSRFFNFAPKIEITTNTNEPTIKYLKRKGVLSNTTYHTLKTSPKYELTNLDKDYIENRFDYPPGFLKKIGNDDVRNIEIINELNEDIKNHNKTLFFACSVEHSKFICSLLSFLGFESAHLDGSTDKGTRQNILKRFKNDTLQIICNYGILTTGFDAPKTDFIFIARPTRSLVLYSQMIGRGLRGPAIGGTETCKITTVIDNIIGLPKEDEIYSYFDEYFDIIDD